ncbi:RimJ/RimL family protein N-acetyltransferase [Pullulanibacillus pueri]|uniref:Alanine acetyltransferase n=1 Tax=Pullulanibacillus pueri TaxID=1437324 RepID=A0A8J3EQB4_9BACL|nr:GNAT family N-acetyltransferase [Pullulanibacillus pueri]MBM7680705.1 RimJ/RimL family protein N-acetyltransferase [Pullulanibacillus pueri]GGH87558.1 alanine acetyltransferase [Pullulanibacillus pueri]
MLKQRDLAECGALFELIRHPEVFPYVRQKAYTPEEFLFLTKQVIEQETQQQLISRTILDEWSQPIGTITLYDIEDQTGYLGTWIGKPYFGKGYNQKAKTAFFTEVFTQTDIHTIFMRIRKENIRSQKAALKSPYVQPFEDIESLHYQKHIDQFNLYMVTKERFLLHQQTIESFVQTNEQELREA